MNTPPVPTEPLIVRVATLYGFPAAVIVALSGVAIFSSVPLNFTIVSGAAAEIVAVFYIALMAGSMIRPYCARFHHVGSVFAVIVWGGRGAGFLEVLVDRVADRGDWSLTGAVLERVALMVACVTWHIQMSRRAGIADMEAQVRALAR